MNSIQDLGTYIYGDETPTEIALLDREGVALDLSGASAISLVAETPERTVVTITASISGASEDGLLLLNGPLGTCHDPGVWNSAVFVGYIKWTQGGIPQVSVDAVKFTIKRFP